MSSRSFASFVGALSIAALLAACGTSADAPAIRGPETAPTGGAPTSNPTSPGSGRGDARPPQTAQGAERLPSCPAGPLFDHLPLAMDDFRALRPLGFTSVPIHIMPARFSSFSRSLPGEDRPPAPVYFPGDAWVTSILTTEFPATGATGFQLTFSPCSETKFGFNHIGSLSEKLQKAVDEGQRTNCREFDSGQGSIARTCQINLLLAVKSGEPVGRSDEFAGVDFVAIDYRVPPAAFANPAHYGGDFFYYVTPVDYFVPELKKQLESRLRSFDGATARTAPPIAGVYMQDLPGRPRGAGSFPAPARPRPPPATATSPLSTTTLAPMNPCSWSVPASRVSGQASTRSARGRREARTSTSARSRRTLASTASRAGRAGRHLEDCLWPSRPAASSSPCPRPTA